MRRAAVLASPDSCEQANNAQHAKQNSCDKEAISLKPEGIR